MYVQVELDPEKQLKSKMYFFSEQNTQPDD